MSPRRRRSAGDRVLENDFRAALAEHSPLARGRYVERRHELVLGLRHARILLPADTVGGVAYWPLRHSRGRAAPSAARQTQIALTRPSEQVGKWG
jgi:hypothetical protein